MKKKFLSFWNLSPKQVPHHYLSSNISSSWCSTELFFMCTGLVWLVPSINEDRTTYKIKNKKNLFMISIYHHLSNYDTSSFYIYHHISQMCYKASAYKFSRCLVQGKLLVFKESKVENVCFIILKNSILKKHSFLGFFLSKFFTKLFPWKMRESNFYYDQNTTLHRLNKLIRRLNKLLDVLLHRLLKGFT